MTKRLNIGTDADGKLFTFPADAATQTFAALARRGAGKTTTAVVMAEEMLERGDCIVVIDPISVWHGLRSSFDGKSKGFPILILGGEHGDLPLDAHAGKTVAEFLVADRVPTILDVSAFGEGEMRRFVADFAERFYQINRQPVHWFVDEADEFAPQSGYNADGARCLGAMQNIVRRGRARGIGCTLITQRSAVLNKSVLTQTECLIALQTTAPQDMDAIKGWLQYHAGKAEVETILATLPKFQRGEAWVYSPGWLKGLTRIQVRQRTTFDSSATPASGQKRSEPKTVAQIDLGQLGERIKAAAETAKANDPRELKKQVADLKAQLAKAEAAKPAAKPEIQRVDVPVVSDADLKRIEKAASDICGVVATAKSRIESLCERAVDCISIQGDIINAVLLKLKAIKAGPDPIALARKAADFGRSVASARPAPARQPRAAKPTGDGSITGPMQRILDAVAWWNAFGIEQPKREAVAFIARYTPSSGGFNNPLGTLRTMGLVDYPSAGLVALTDSGRASANQPDATPTRDEAHDRVRSVLDGPKRRIFDALLSLGGLAPREVLAEKSQYESTSGGFNNPLGTMRSIGLVDYPSSGQVELAEFLR